MAKAKKSKTSGSKSSLASLLKARVEKLWAKFEKSGALSDYLAYDDALNGARAQGVKIDKAGK